MVPATTRRGIWAGLALSVIAGAAAYFVLRAPPAPVAEDLGDEDRTRTAAMQRIAAESAATFDLPRAEAPETVVSPPIDAPAPVPPEGYAFPSFHEMTSAPMARDSANDEITAPAPDWLTSGEARQRLVDQAASAGRDWAFGWVRHAGGANQGEVERALEGLGAHVIGTAGDLLRVQLPGDSSRLAEIARLPQVSGVGAMPAAAKTPAQLASDALEQPPSDRVPVFVTLMADDRDGRWRRTLENMGAEVGWFDADTRAYAANIRYGILDVLTAADFVVAVEPVGGVEPALHAAAPAMGADALRTHDAATGLFSGIGGASVPIGVMDTGLNINHLDISSNRRSVCGGNFEAGGAARNEDQRLWVDSDGHGTHVTGIFAGSGTVDPRRAGIAPLVQDIRFAKALDSFGSATAVGWSRAQDWLSRPTACGPQAPVKPLVLNSSLGVGGAYFEAYTVIERKLDAVVWRARQLYAIAAGNEGPRVSYAVAKNTLAVGAVSNDGRIARFSSRGPTWDGRLFPHVVGTGVNVSAARGGGSERDYVAQNGTSMASPAVAGVGALIMDGVPALRERPAAVRALLMASAVKPDAFFERRDVAWLLTAGRGRFRLDNSDGPGELQHIYGLGKASARTSVLTRDAEDGWVSGAAEATVAGDSFSYQDIVVPAGASRLDVVLTWDEPAAESISPSLLNDLDLWIDRGATCSADQGACGDHASRSQVDNVEWVILRNPPPGTYRLKAVPRRVYGQAPRAGLAWTVIRGPSSPQLTVAAEAPTVAAAPNDAFDVDLALSVDGYVASGTTLRVDCRAADDSAACSMVEFLVPHASSATREDGLSRSLAGESSAAIALGELAAGEQQELSLRFKARPEAANFRLHFTAKTWNGVGASTSVEVRVGEAEGMAPAPVGRPPNDDFADAAQLTGESGRAAPVHILLATDEPGEPAFINEAEARPRSVWYRWSPSATGPARFTIARGHENGLADRVAFDLYRGDRIVSLRRLANKFGGGLSFFAEAGTDYFIRLGLGSDLIADPAPDGPRRHATSPVELHWAPGGAPANDHFADAIALGDEEAVAGNNQGATLEVGELVGQDVRLQTYVPEGVTASVWYRWTAPTTADWRFSVDRRHLRAMVFVGDDVASTRLVSGAAKQHATFPAHEGEEYRIAVAAENALYGGTDYRLTWAPEAREGSPHDDMANAEPINGPFHFSSFNIDTATVEADEPPESGVRTAWWSWEAAADGQFTWRATTNYLQILRFFGFEFELPAPFAMRFAAFTGESTAALTALATSGGGGKALTEFTLDAKAGQRYWFSIGLPRDAALATLGDELRVQLGWGPTPENDSLAGAVALEGATGTMSGSNSFATTEDGELTLAYGDSSLWWTWQPPEAGTWYRFSLVEGSGVLAVFKKTGAGFAGLELVTLSNGSLGPHEAVFQAEEGAEYVIRLAAIFGDGNENQSGRRGEFEILWDVHGTPVWLRYANRVVAGMVDDDGVPLQLASVIGGAVNSDGTQLYANTVQGLRVFQRDEATGALTLMQALDPVGPTPSTMFWDETSDSLLTGSCEGWNRFRHEAEGDDAPMLVHAGALGGDAPCAQSWSTHQNHTQTAKSALMSPDGGTVYVVQQHRAIDTYALDGESGESGEFAFVDTLGNFDFRDAAMHGAGTHLYAVAPDRLYTLRPDSETGALSLTGALGNGDGDGSTGPLVEGLESTRALALDKSNQYLFVLAEQGVRTLVFNIGDDPAHPRFMGGVRVQSGGPAPALFPHDECLTAQARNTTAAIDVFCSRYIYTVAVQPDGTIRQTEILGANQLDRFGRRIPYYDSGCVAACVSTPSRSSLQVGVATPDGKHLYAIYAKPQIMTFERFGRL